MATNPNIILGIQTPNIKPYDAMGATTGALTLANLLKQGQVNDIAVQGKQLEFDKAKRLQSLLQGGASDDDLAKAGYIDEASKFGEYGQKKQAAQDVSNASQTETAGKKLKLWGQVSKYVYDNPTQENARRAVDIMAQAGLIKPEAGASAYEQINSQTPEQIRAIALQHFQSSLDSEKQLPENRLSDSGRQLIPTSQDKFTGNVTQGTGVIDKIQSPDSSASVSATLAGQQLADKRASTIATETARHNRAMEENARLSKPDAFGVTPAQKFKLSQQKPKDMAALKTTETTSDTLLKEIDKLIGSEDGKIPEHPGLQGSVGYIDAQVPPITKDQADAQALIRGLMAKTSVQGLQSIRASGSAPGSITEKEWPIFQNYLKTIDPKQSYPQFVEQLKELRLMSQEFKQAARNNFNSRYDGIDQPDNIQTPTASNIPAGWTVKAH